MLAILRTFLTRYRIRFTLQLLMAIVANTHRLQPAARWNRHLVLATRMTEAFAAATTMMLGQASLFEVALARVTQLQKHIHSLLGFLSRDLLHSTHSQ